MKYLLCLFILFSFAIGATSFEEVPIAYKGRFRPMNAYAELNGIITSPDELLQMHFKGHSGWDNEPLFRINNAKVKLLLNLDVKTSKFSYNQLNQIETDHILIPYYYHKAYNDPANRSRSDRLEVLPGLWVVLKDYEVSPFAEDIIAIKNKLKEYEALSHLNIIPSRKPNGQWISIEALKADRNPTPYSEDVFQKLKANYLQLEQNYSAELQNTFALNLLDGYSQIAGTVYQNTTDKQLHYPTMNQLWAEYFYYKFPLSTLIIITYGIAILTRKMSFISLAFILHTFLLGLRCYILERPPVSNMFETVVYVPWVAVLTSLVLYYFFRNRTILMASTIGAFFFLVFLKLTHLDSGMENVQAVLDSQYWLMIHVLMVVGSYGLFVLAGILGHIYLGMYLYYKEETTAMKNIAQNILQTIYVGTIMLISGTILGGVWAAESWGRFWDWDPKESWAFISSCIYLIWIHLFSFRHIGNFGLAIGSIVGLCAIGFTWYGVNYILGTGLHSYGFGSGGEVFFYIYLLLELIFIGIVGKIRFAFNRRGVL